MRKGGKPYGKSRNLSSTHHINDGKDVNRTVEAQSIDDKKWCLFFCGKCGIEFTVSRQDMVHGCYQNQSYVGEYRLAKCPKCEAIIRHQWKMAR